MSAERARRLEAVPGWVWDPQAASWWTFLGELQGYSDIHHVPGRVLRLPQSQLSDWASGQRMAYSRGHLASDRVAALEAVPGWCWNVWEAKVEVAVDAAAAWLAREGPVDPTLAHRENGVPVRAWMARWRSDHAKGELSPDVAERLDSIAGWSWKPLPSARALEVTG